MMVKVLNPAGSSGFILEREDGAQVVVDMGAPAGEGFLQAAERLGLRKDAVRLVLFTHVHRDHTDPAGIEELFGYPEVKFIIPELCWHKPSKHLYCLGDVREMLEDSGRLILVGLSGEGRFNGVRMRWGPLTHEVAGDDPVRGGSLAFRIGDVLVGGDGPVRDLFSPVNRFLREPGEAPVRTLVLSVAHESPEAVLGRDDLPERRVRRYLEEHGLFSEFLEAMRRPEEEGFFRELRLVVPTHVRQEPPVEVAERMAGIAEDEGRRLGFGFAASIRG